MTGWPRWTLPAAEDRQPRAVREWLDRLDYSWAAELDDRVIPMPDLIADRAGGTP